MPQSNWRPISRRYPIFNLDDPLAGFWSWLVTLDKSFDAWAVRTVCAWLVLLLVVQGGKALGWW